MTIEVKISALSMALIALGVDATTSTNIKEEVDCLEVCNVPLSSALLVLSCAFQRD